MLYMWEFGLELMEPNHALDEDTDGAAAPSQSAQIVDSSAVTPPRPAAAARQSLVSHAVPFASPSYSAE